MTVRMSHPVQPVTYLRTPSVALRLDQALARNLGRTSVGGVDQHLLDIRRAGAIAVRTFLEFDRPERAIWFASDIMGLLDVGIRPASLDVAALDESRTDGQENERWEAYRNEPTESNWKLYERAAHRDIAALLAKLSAGRQKHGRTA